MIPYILAIAGGYLIGSAMKSEKFAGGGSVGDKLDNFNVANLDRYEEMVYNDMISKGRSKREALTILINQVEGDYSQLSYKLGQIAMEMEEEMTGEREGERRMGMDFAEGGNVMDNYIIEFQSKKGDITKVVRVKADSESDAKKKAVKKLTEMGLDSDDFSVSYSRKSKYAEGGMAKEGKWIQEAVKNKGALRKTAKREGLIKGDEKLSMADIKKLEKKGGKTAKRAYLAETLKKMNK